MEGIKFLIGIISSILILSFSCKLDEKKGIGSNQTQLAYKFIPLEMQDECHIDKYINYHKSKGSLSKLVLLNTLEYSVKIGLWLTSCKQTYIQFDRIDYSILENGIKINQETDLINLLPPDTLIVMKPTEEIVVLAPINTADSKLVEEHYFSLQIDSLGYISYKTICIEWPLR